jgi:WD40 repeat protein
MDPRRLANIRDTVRADPATLEADPTLTEGQGGACLPRVLLLVLALALAAAALLFVQYYRVNTYKRLVDRQLRGPIQRVEMQPFARAERIVLTDAPDIRSLMSLIADSEPHPERGRVIRPPTCDVFLHFADGHTERLRIGEIPVTTGRQGPWSANRTSLAIAWRGYIRYRNAESLSGLYSRLRVTGALARPGDSGVTKSGGSDYQITALDRRTQAANHVRELLATAATVVHKDMTEAHLALREALAYSPDDAEAKAAQARWQSVFDRRRVDLISAITTRLDASKPGTLDRAAYLECQGWLLEAEGLGGKPEPGLRGRVAAFRPAADFSRFRELYRFQGDAADRHEIRGFAFHPDGRRVVAACADEFLRVWDTATGILDLRLLAHPAYVVDFSPDGKSFVTVGLPTYNTITPEGYTRAKAVGTPPINDRGLVLSWDANTFGRLGAFPVDRAQEFYCARFRPDGRELLVGGFDRVASLWDTQTRTKIRDVAHFPGYVHFAAYLSDGQRILLGSDERSWTPWHAELRLSIHDLADGQITAERPEGSRFAVPSPDGRRLLVTSGSIGQSTQVLRLPELQAEGLTLVGHSDCVTAASWSPDGHTIVTASWDRTARLWDSATGRELACLSGHAAALTHALFNPDGDRVLTHARDDSIVVWGELDTSPLTRVLQARDRSIFESATLVRPLESAVVSPDGSRVVAADESGLRILDGGTGKPLRTWARPAQFVDPLPLAFSPNGKHIAVDIVKVGEAADGTSLKPAATILIFDAESGHVTHNLREDSESGHVVAFSNSGQWLATAGVDRNLRLWDMTGGQRRYDAPLNDSASCVAFSPDDRLILVTEGRGTGGSLLILDAVRGIPLFRQPVRHHSAFSADGRFLALCPNGATHVSIIDLSTMEAVHHLDFPDKPDRVEALAFSPDGKELALAMFDRSVLIVDTQMFHKVIRFPIHSLELEAGLGQGPDALRFAPDNRHLLVAVNDGSYRLCDKLTGREVRRLIVFQNAPSADATIRPHPLGPARFLSDGKLIVTGPWLWGMK